jgi:hypothetical protein
VISSRTAVTSAAVAGAAFAIAVLAAGPATAADVIANLFAFDNASGQARTLMVAAS